MLTLTHYAQTAAAEEDTPQQPSPPLVLLHGWGSNSNIWQPIIAHMQATFTIITVDVCYQNETAESLCAQLSQQLPRQYHLCGWSLGGMLATMLAAQQPSAVQSLLTLASNMRFVANDLWPDAMDKHAYDIFYHAVQADPGRALKRFMSLIVQGDQHLHEQRNFLRKKILPAVELAGLLQGLDILSSINNTALLPTIRCPVLHIFGDADSLVPISAVEKIRTLNRAHHTEVINNSGHLLHMPGVVLMSVINAFYTDNRFHGDAVG